MVQMGRGPATDSQFNGVFIRIGGVFIRIGINAAGFNDRLALLTFWLIPRSLSRVAYGAWFRVRAQHAHISWSPGKALAANWA
jgi:hypothetical protein